MIALHNVTISATRADGLWRRSRIDILQNLEFSVPKGEICVLVGASGIGKTLLARAILNVLPDGVTCTGNITRPQMTAYLPQAISHLDPTTRINRQVLRGATGSGSLPCHNRYPHQISGGEAKRALAAMMPDAPAVIADEPTAGLDPITASLVLADLYHRAAQGAAVLVITHDLCALLPFAQKVLLLAQNRLVASHPTADFVGDGAALSDTARRYWRALPQNDFYDA